MYDQRPIKTKVSISIDSDVEKACKDLAERDDRSFSQYINHVLRKHLEAIGYFGDSADENDQ